MKQHAFTFSVLLLAGAVFAQVIPGEFTDPSNLRKQASENKGYQPPAELRFPYIATYYVEPTVMTDEDCRISFFVTDFESSKIRFLDNSCRFDIYLEYLFDDAAPKRLVMRDKTSGDHRFNLGKLAAGNYAFCIWAVDKEGRESHRVWHEFRVCDRAALEIPQDQIYKMTQADLTAYSLDNNGAHGRKIIVDVGEIPAKTDIKALRALALGWVDKYAAENNVKRTSATPGYTILIPASKGKILNRSFEVSRVVYDDGYDTNAVEQASVKNAEGLQRLIDDKSTNGFRKVILLPGTYRISATKKIVLPDNFTLDLGGATIKQNPFTGCSSVLVNLASSYDAHLVNGTLEGDYYEHDYKNSPNNSEWPMGFTLSGDCRYSSVEKIVVRDITGYGAGNGLGKDKRGDFNFFYRGLGKFTAGSLNKKDGTVNTNDAYRFTCDFQKVTDIKKYKYLQVSKYLGYQGRATRSWNMTACWYDAEKNFVCSETLFQYRPVRIPDKAEFLRVSIEVGSGKEADEASLRLIHFRIPWNCAVKNCVFDRCRCVGYAPAQMKNMLIADNEFMYSGEAAAKCAFDAEDGWDQMQDIYLTRNYFHDNPVNNSILTCAGHNFIIENNRGDVYLWGRTHSPCIRGNEANSITVNCDSRLRSGYGRIENNSIAKSFAIRTDANRYDGYWDFVLAGLDFTNPSNKYNVSMDKAGRLVDCKFADRRVHLSNIFGGSITNCNDEFIAAGKWVGITVTDGTYKNFYMTNTYSRCTFTNVKFHNFRGALQTFENCTFKNCDFGTVGGANIRFVRCRFDGGKLNGGYWSKPAQIGYLGCEFNLDAPYFIIPLYTIGKIGFKDCKAVNASGKGTALVDIFDLRPQDTDKELGKLAIENCTFGAGISNAVAVSGYKGHASRKKLEIRDTGNKFTEKGVFLIKAENILPDWTVEKE